VSADSGTSVATTLNNSGFLGVIGTRSRTAASQTPITITLTGAAAVGDFVHLTCELGANKTITGSITDTRGNTWVTGTVTSNSTTITLITAACIVTTALQVNDVVQFTPSSSTTRSAATLLRYSNVSTATPDTTGSAVGTSTAPSATAGGATPVANELVIGTCAFDSGATSVSTYTQGASFTKEDQENANGQASLNQHSAVEDRIITTTGTQTAAGTISVSGAWAANVSTYPIGPAVSDTTPPTPPNSIHATVNGQHSIILTWSGATDNIGVTGYNIYRGGVLAAAVPATPLSYTDPGLTPGTTYTYTIKSFDQAGNLSTTFSPSATATTTITVAGSLNAYIEHGKWWVDSPSDNSAANLPPGTANWTDQTGSTWKLIYPSTATSDLIAQALAMRPVQEQNWDSSVAVQDLIDQNTAKKIPQTPGNVTAAEVIE
jgi:hypothetical protein